MHDILLGDKDIFYTVNCFIPNSQNSAWYSKYSIVLVEQMIEYLCLFYVVC